MHKITKELGSVHDGDSLEDLTELSTCGHTVEIREGQAEELVRELHNN